MDLTVDHVTVAGADLDALDAAFASAGLPAEYGGAHSNGVTHMSVVGFRDGSYVELVSTEASNTASPWWNDPIRADGGPCAWAVGVDDIEAASETLRERGVAIDGPHEYERERPDGTLVEWDLTFLGGGDPGHTLPFLISDRTPRERRVRPTGDLGASAIRGVETVVLAVANLEAAIERFETAFDLRGVERGVPSPFDASVARFPGTPVALAEPTSDGWLADRLDRFGPLPVAYLLGLDARADGRFDVGRAAPFGDREVRWLGLTEPVGCPYLGLVDATR
ncbi:VOC family protein [Halomarina rubra]|uniref:VOC family protein n=1 Tax=Halomarina rubra TaxID=2071873 RepID=A0ABD6AWU1_9EURY|nr:VOC family protein [Halomarina rubra]